MQVKLVFATLEEFVEFILNSASWKYEILENIVSVRVKNTNPVYSVSKPEGHLATLIVINYMLNDVQRENDSAGVNTTDDNFLKGSQGIRDFFKKLPESFVLRAGWRTDYIEIVFSQNAPEV